MATWPFVAPEWDFYRRKSCIDRHALSSYTKLVLLLTGFGTDNARSEPLGADEGGSRIGADVLSCGAHCAMAVPASGRIVRVKTM
jgi:hypothetical protein